MEVDVALGVHEVGEVPLPRVAAVVEALQRGDGLQDPKARADGNPDLGGADGTANQDGRDLSKSVSCGRNGVEAEHLSV